MTVGVTVNGEKTMEKRAPQGRLLSWSFHSNYVYPIGTLVVIALLWELGVVILDYGTWFLPRPSQVLITCFTSAAILIPAAIVTGQEILIGFGLAIVVGLALAMMVVAHPTIEKSFYPLLVATQVVPKIAVAPILTIWFGYGMTPKVMITFLIAFFPIVIDSIAGFRSVSPSKLYLAQTMGASELQIFLKIRMPSALPSILSGIKIGSTFAVVGAIVGEFIASDRGLGRVILIANGDFDTVTMFAAITYLTVIGVALFALVEFAERLLIPWHVSRRTATADKNP